MRGHVHQRGTTWTVVVYLGKDPAGRKRQHTKGGFPTKAAAEEHAARVIAARADGRGIPQPRQRLGEYLERWLARLPAGLSPLTRLQYGYSLRKHVIPALGQHWLTDLSQLQVEQWLEELQGRGFKPKHVYNVYSRLRTALADAVEYGLIARNPAERPGRRRSLMPEPRAYEPAVLDHEHTRLYLAYLRRATPWWLLFTIALRTGLRRGELLGLRRCDVQWGARAVLAIKQELTYVPHEGVRFAPPKSPSGRRPVKLTRQLTEQLRAWVEEHDRAAIVAGRQPGPEELVFARPETGRTMHPSSLTRLHMQLRERFTARHVRLHDLRHTHASQLLADGVPLKVVQERLGHSRASYTLERYVHTLPSIQDDAVAAIERRETRPQRRVPS